MGVSVSMRHCVGERPRITSPRTRGAGAPAAARSGPPVAGLAWEWFARARARRARGAEQTATRR
eukprot:7804635-Lingulodinium_polyedra.AAC.1